MSRQTPPDNDYQHNYNGSERGRREKDDYYDRYSGSNGRERYSYYKSSLDDRTSKKYTRGRSRSRSRSSSISRSKYSRKKSLKRSRSRSRSKYDRYSDRKRSRSRSYSERRRSRSRSSYSRHPKRSRSRNSSRQTQRQHKTLAIEMNDKISDTTSKHYKELSNLKEKNTKDTENSKYYGNERHTDPYLMANIKIPEGNNKDNNYNYDNNSNYYDDDDDEDDDDQEEETEYKFTSNVNDIEPFEKEKIHRQIEERLRETLAREGKIYPPRKTEASHPIFANDGSFLEVFKKMQEQAAATATTSTNNNTNNASKKSENNEKKSNTIPIVNKRRGGRILKTGVVAKTSIRNQDSNDPKDFWALYLEEVKKYKNATCDMDGKTRPLVK